MKVKNWKSMEDLVGKNMKGEEDREEFDDQESNSSLPGFRFHPTDEELVGFYLRRKVDNKSIAVELIKHVDIYQYDPWDLPRVSNVGEKEWYFFCMRGRKYRNSIRPNRVTGSGFWKATGIDKPIYSDRDCIGLKKSLVYYIGMAGKGTKTDWMMHEFRLPPTGKTDSVCAPQQAEVWTLCRIFKRATPHKRPIIVPNRKPVSLTDSSSKTSSLDSDHTSHPAQHDVDVAVDFVESLSHKLPETLNPYWNCNHHYVGLINPAVPITSPSFCHTNFPSFWNINGGDYSADDGGSSCWDELGSVVQGYTEN